MKERPILFNTEMVRAILDGRKTQTRRVIKGDHNYVRWNPVVLNGYGGWTDDHGRPVKCPYGKVGDRLWVQEKFAVGEIVGAEGSEWYLSQCKDENSIIPYQYCIENEIGIEDVIWKPSSQMKKEDSRITLEIENIRVERVQEITWEDAREEGIQPKGIGSDYEDIKAFEKLWNSINESCGYGWNENPWVWVVEFKRVEK